MNEFTLLNRRRAARDSELAKMRIGEFQYEQISHHPKSAVMPIGQLHLRKRWRRGMINVVEHALQSSCRQSVSSIHRRNIRRRCTRKWVEPCTVFLDADSLTC